MNRTLAELIREHSSTGAILQDAGQGSATLKGRFADAADLQAYMGETLRPIPAHWSDDGLCCHHSSEWIVEGTGENPYRVRVLF